MSQQQQISEEAQKAINQLSETTSTDAADLEEKFIELLQEEEEKGVSSPTKRALRRLSLDQKGNQMADTEQLRGYVLGASDAINTSRSAINRAKEYIKNKGPERAIKHGLVKKVPSGDIADKLASVTVKGDPEDTVFAVIDSNDNSPTSGEVLPAEDWIRYVYGAVWRNADDGPHWFSGVINAENEGDKPAVPPMHEPVSFEAAWVGESDQNNTIRLRFRETEPFEAVEEFGGPDVIDLFENDDLLGHVSLDEANADEYGRNDVLATYGSVTYMELAPEGDQSRRLTVVDPFAFDSDLSRTVWLPDHVDVNFAEESDVYVVGQASPSNNEYADSIEALGVFVHPDYRVDRSDIESMADEGQDDGDDDQEADDDGAAVEMGKNLEDPSEASDDEGSESGDQQAEDEGRGDDVVSEVIATADYGDLQEVASYVDEVPGSGISEKEMRQQLIDELGATELERRLKTPKDADDADGDDQDDAEDADTHEAEDDASEDDEESVSSGDIEPSDEDEEWQW